MMLYFAGPLFSTSERAWNEDLARALRDGGHEVFLPQEQEPGLDAAGIFAHDVGGIDWADTLVAIMDGPDPDAGTAWEVGYAYGKKPVILVSDRLPKPDRHQRHAVQRDARPVGHDPPRSAVRADVPRRGRDPRCRASREGGIAIAHAASPAVVAQQR